MSTIPNIGLLLCYRLTEQMPLRPNPACPDTSGMKSGWHPTGNLKRKNQRAKLSNRFAVFLTDSSASSE
jgi:hypothetical protein